MRVKLSIETNFQVSTANTVPVISIQNKIFKFRTNKNLAETSQLKKCWKFKGKKIFLCIKKKELVPSTFQRRTTKSIQADVCSKVVV